MVNALNQQYNSLGLPALQTLFPELMDTVQGKGSPLTTAAMAPVQAATNAALRGAKQQATGLVNPDLLYENIAKTGQEQAGLAAGNVTLGSLSDLANLIGGQQSMVSSGLSQLPGVASQYGDIAKQLDPWNAIAAIVGAGAQAYGASQGMKAGSPAPSAVKPAAATQIGPAVPSSTFTLQQAYDMIRALPTQSGSNNSAPSSQLTQPSLSGMPQYSGTKPFYGA